MLLWGCILAVGVVAMASYFVVPWVYCRWSRRSLQRLTMKRDYIVLTLDDGPGRQLTMAVLDLLAATGSKATFFLLGRNIRGNEDLVRRIHAQGHEIGSHSYNHLHAWKVAPWRSVSDIRRGFQAIDEALGTRGGRYPFRPPYGKLNLVTLLYLLARRIPIAYWTIDSGDTWSGRPDKGRAANLSRTAGGGVVLAHDFDRSVEEDVYQFVLDALQSTLSTAQECGLQLSTFSELFEEPKRGATGPVHHHRELEHPRGSAQLPADGLRADEERALRGDRRR
jgi:peptidoglycan/xylan/chitin deacetylase (PgdA/CDA1 family)